jgi:hypothetical protein
MQEHEHNNAAAESTPQPPEMPAGANIPREASDSHDGHESPSPPPEQEDAADAGAVPVTTIRPPATAERLPQEQEAALLRRYGGVGATATTDGQTVVIINNPPPKRRWRRTKRFFKAFLTLLFLIISGNILLAAFGEEGLSAATNLLHLIWWPATLIRLLVYLGISWLLLPRLNRYIREQALQRIAAQREASLADGVLDHNRLQQLDAAETRIHQAGITPKFLLGLLLAFDVVALQLPYLLH